MATATGPSTKKIPKTRQRATKAGYKATTRSPSAPAAAPSGRLGETPLRIPYGNKEMALKLGARYRDGGWYGPADVDLAAF